FLLSLYSFRMFKKTYHWMLRHAEGPKATAALGAVAFIESSVFPLPPDLMLIPMGLARREKAFFYALVATVASVLGGMLGYAIGFFFYETVGQWILNLYGGAQEWYGHFSEFFQKYGGWVILRKGLTPFPFKVLTILSGMTRLDLGVFIVSSIVARAGRFFLVAGLIYVYGDKIRGFLEKHLDAALLGFLLLAVAGFLAVKFLF
ncbi:MAG TPA: YqaA family protein, partial [Alphaproteobacteria bacterium]|nr:YqaA family protein [Alphaproteobacteria bacterium]